MARSLPRLVKRNGVFYFRMAVPRHLTQRLERQEIKGSLRTGDARAAKHLVNRISVAVDTLMLELPRMPNVTASDVADLLKGYFKQILSQSVEHAWALPRDSHYDPEGELAYLNSSMHELQEQLSRRPFTPALQSEAQSLLETIHPEKLSSATEQVQQVCEGILSVRPGTF